MRARDLLGIVLVLALGAACAGLAARVARHLERSGALRLELGRERATTLEPRTRAALEALDERLTATYYVSRRERMPSSMRRLERQVTGLLEAMRAAVPGRFDYKIVDPEDRPELSGFAANRRVAPFRVRSVARDAYSERTVWSALTLALGTRAPAVVNGIAPETLPRLQRAIVAHLEQARAPRAPRLALATPLGRGYDELAAALAERGPLERVDLDGGAPLPADADLLFWMAPGRATPARLEELDRFLAAGRSLVVAGALLEADGGLRAGPEGPELATRPGAAGLEPLLAHLGLRPAPGLLCDARAEEALLADAPVAAPFAIRCIAPNQDFRRWDRQPNGTLLFALAAPLALDAARLARRGTSAHVLATTSDDTWRVALEPGATVALPALARERGLELPKQALAVELAPDDPWRGHVVALAATTPFEDGVLAREHDAHRALVRTLVDELASDERLVSADAPAPERAPLPRLVAWQRAAWRLACVALVPALLLAAFVVPRLREARALRARAPAGPRRPALPLALAGALWLALGLAVLARAAGLRADASAAHTAVLAPETRALAQRLGRSGAVRVTRAFSPRASLPPRWRTGLERLDRLLDDLRRAGADLALERADPADDPALARRLEALGARRQDVVDRDAEETVVRSVWATLVLERDGKSELVSIAEARDLEELELRVAFALWRLETGRHPTVAFASDVPRLSAAEAHEDFQQKGLFAPSGTDVYSRARALLERQGYRVTHVNPRAPEPFAGADLVVWMQPRRPVAPMLEPLLRFLHGGGRVLLCAQHFVVQSRQYRGAGFELVYWPQPQSCDLERLYLPEIGVRLVREVLFDELSTTIETDTQITGRGAQRDFERQSSALPFLVRASSAAYDRASPVTRTLGDQALAWPSAIELDRERLGALGLTARTLIATSPHAWRHDWKGGWIPPELLAGPPADPATGAPAWAGPQALAVLVEGVFPRPEAPLALDPASAPPPDPAPWPDAAPGALLLVGASEPFKDASLDDPRFRADHLLGNAVASLVLEPDLAALATRRRVPRGVPLVDERTRLVWRAAVVGGGPLALVALFLALALARRRAPHAPALGGAGGAR